jgi:3-oxoacyl-[acyl-carrier-protein] synthase II
MGHTLGASGAIELIASLIMMEKGCIYPTRNLESVGPDCDGIFHVMKKLTKEINIIVKNAFAFGGINASIVCKKLLDS